jgi:hypothetical protein
MTGRRARRGKVPARRERAERLGRGAYALASRRKVGIQTAVLDHSRTLPQGDGGGGPALAGGVPSGLSPFLRFELLEE